MSFVNAHRHSFIIQLWMEPREIESAPEEWRGIIEHTTSGQRRAVFTTNDIIQFIEGYVVHLHLQENPQDSMRVKLSRRSAEEPVDHEPPSTE
jgi:hypothetical protein